MCLQCGTRDESPKLQLGQEPAVGLQVPVQKCCISPGRQGWFRLVYEIFPHVKKYTEMKEAVVDIKQFNNSGRNKKQHRFSQCEKRKP